MDQDPACGRALADPPERGARGRASRRAAISIVALASLAVAAESAAQDGGGESPAPASPQGPDAATSVPAFLRDTTLTLRLRSYYVGNEAVTGAEREAWAGGGWLSYRSGWLLDAVRIGATWYGSAPLRAPADKGETLLLAPGREGYQAIGEAFATVRHGNVAALTVYRHAIDQPYIDRQDNAMTPNTFEGVTLAGRLRSLEYFAGYVARIKTRNADAFVPMSEAAGARGSDRGVAMLGAKLAPLRGLEIRVAEQFGIDTYNTLFAQVEQVWPVGAGVRLRLGGQFTDQRAVGDALVATTRVRRWSTQNGSARLTLARGPLAFRASASVTASGNRMQNPWGFYPGYLRLSEMLFDNANEKAWHVGIAYDLSAVVGGLDAWSDVGRGVDSMNPVTRARLPGETEYDVVVTYRPPSVKGLRLRVRAVLLERDGADQLGYTLRLIANWEIPLLGGAMTAQRI